MQDKMTENLTWDNNISESMHELNVIIQEMASATEQLSVTSKETSELSGNAAGTSLDIAESIQDIADKAHDGHEKTIVIKDSANEMKRNVSQAMDKAALVFQGTRTELESSIEASKVVDQISVLSKSITEVNRQTNLLSVNAAIEAARAGNAGKGFAVVANEIKKLAKKSEEAISEIQSIAKNVTDAVANLTESSNKLLEFVSVDVNNDYHFMMQVADNYSRDTSDINTIFSDFSTTSQDLLNSIRHLLQSMDQIVFGAEDSADGIKNIVEKLSAISKISRSIIEELNQ